MTEYVVDPPAVPMEQHSNHFVSALRACRPQQWVKNSLLFAPIIAGHAFAYDAMMAATIAFLCYCGAASAVYLVNDLMDVQHDRRHPTKCNRPLASGAISPCTAIIMVFVLAVSAMLIAILVLPVAFAGVLVGYLILAALYSRVLKRQPILDVATLAMFYGMRVVAGGVATGIVVSGWLLVFSLFAFTSLAFVKRYVELHRLAGDSTAEMPGRGLPGFRSRVDPQPWHSGFVRRRARLGVVHQ